MIMGIVTNRLIPAMADGKITGTELGEMVEELADSMGFQIDIDWEA